MRCNLLKVMNYNIYEKRGYPSQNPMQDALAFGHSFSVGTLQKLMVSTCFSNPHVECH